MSEDVARDAFKRDIIGRPIWYLLDDRRKKAVDSYIDDLLEKGWIKSSPVPDSVEETAKYGRVVVTTQSDNTLEVGIDFQNFTPAEKLLSESDDGAKAQIPSREEFIDKVKGYKFYSLLQLKDPSGKIASRREAKFVCHRGIFAFTVLPRDLPQAWKIIHKRLAFIYANIPHALVYADQVVLFSNDLEQHEKLVEAAIEAATSKGLFWDLHRCRLISEFVDVLGVRVSAGGVEKRDA